MNSQQGSEHFQEMLPPEPVAMTLAEFLESDIEDCEYVEGELVPMSSPSWEHAKISANVFWYLQLHVRVVSKLGLGCVVTVGGFRVGEQVLKPDVAFVSTARLPEERRRPSPVPPDVAVEVISPTDAVWNVLEKAQAYLDAGTQMVWIIESVMKTVMVYRSETDIKLLTREDTLTGEDVVQGFSCPVSQLFT